MACRKCPGLKALNEVDSEAVARAVRMSISVYPLSTVLEGETRLEGLLKVQA